MGTAQQRKVTNRQVRRAFGTEACATIESLHKEQLEMAAGLTELERKERVLDQRTRELRDDINTQANRIGGFVTMTFRQRLRWLLRGRRPL